MSRSSHGVHNHSRSARNVERSGPGLDGIAYAHLVDTLAHAVLVFDSTGGLTYYNRAARDAAAASGLLIDGRRIKGATAILNERIELALRHALEGSANIVRSDHGKAMLHWLFHPYRGDSGSAFHAGAVALARIPRTPRALELFAQAYHLTPAERRVLSYVIAHDSSIETVASRVGIGISTVRSHLKNLFQKTRTQHQRGLVWLVLSLPEPPIEL